MPAKDLELCRQRCEIKGYGGFTLWHGRAYLKPWAVVHVSSVPHPGLILHLRHPVPAIPPPCANVDPTDLAIATPTTLEVPPALAHIQIAISNNVCLAPSLVNVTGPTDIQLTAGSVFSACSSPNTLPTFANITQATANSTETGYEFIDANSVKPEPVGSTCTGMKMGNSIDNSASEDNGSTARAKSSTHELGIHGPAEHGGGCKMSSAQLRGPWVVPTPLRGKNRDMTSVLSTSTEF